MNIPDINKMTLREKLAQLLIVRMSDLLMDADSSYTKMRAPQEAAEIMEKNQFGGIWFHGNVDVNQINDVWNKNIKFSAKELKEWYADIRKNVKIPVIAAADAIGPEAAPEYSVYPEGLAVGASADKDIAYNLGRCVARELAWAGLDWIWSPIADIHNRRSSQVGRAFANIADENIRCCIDYAKGIQSQQMATATKHFPGVDCNDVRDTHIVTSKIGVSLDEWKKGQGRVFQEIIDAGVDAVMCLATAFPAVDDTKINGRYIPAGLSSKVLIDLLKRDMGFKGVVITDDVNMGGFTNIYTGGRLYAEFIKAGNDMLLGVRIDAVDLLEEEVKKGTVSMERIDDAVSRVLELKRKVGLFDRGYREADYTLADAVRETEEVSTKLAETSLTLVCDRNNRLPFDKSKVKKAAIVGYSHNKCFCEKLEPMKKAFEEYGIEASIRHRINSFEEAKEVAENNDLIIYVGNIEFHNPKGAPSFYGDEFWSLRHAFVYGEEKSIGLGMGFPHIHYDFMEDANVFINAYSTAPAMQKAFVKAIFGEIKLVGKSPVILDE